MDYYRTKPHRISRRSFLKASITAATWGSRTTAKKETSCGSLDGRAARCLADTERAQQISERFVDLDRMHQIGEVQIKISGCINACGHHHVGHIGILGLEKAGEEFYQVTLGGAADEDAALGAVVGRGFSAGEVVDAVETILETYVTLREEGERFIETLRRIGLDPFKERLYAAG